MKDSVRLYMLVALLLLSALTAGCAGPRESSPPAASSKPDRGQVVASVAQTRPGDALRSYLYEWMLDYNQETTGERVDAAETTWTPEVPDDFVSVMPAVSMTDFKTVAVWSATIAALEPPTDTRATYRADFMFWRGNPLSSAGTGAVPLSSSATYDVSWDEENEAWAVSLTSAPPEDSLVESQDQGDDSP